LDKITAFLRYEASVVNWARIPDLVCAVLMIWTFGSVSRDKQNYVSRIWMLGWVMILFHATSALLNQVHGIWGRLDYIAFSVTLVWAGLLFCHASMPERDRASSLWLLGSLATASFVYMTILCLSPGRHWAMNLAAVLVTVLPLAVMLGAIRTLNDWRHWALVAMCTILSIFLLMVQNQRPNGVLAAWNGYLFAVYIACCFFTSRTGRRTTSGANVTVCGFLAWALVFVLEPLQLVRWPQVHVEHEVWHLPAFVVAMGMLLMLLEDQLKQSRYLAWHDELTGLPNRRLFQDRFDNALARARRKGEALGLLYVDLDEFKQVNDTLGHQAGDTLLRKVSVLFARRLRSSDTIARTGGDEFCVLLENPASRPDAEAVGHELQSLMNEPIEVDERSIRVGASVGVSLFPDDGEDADSLYRVADLRMYAAKHGAGGPEKPGVLFTPSQLFMGKPATGTPSVNTAALTEEPE
jgi:diguanylate cyclase (GGDEF)-like protein